ncbi:MAG: T9SS type A sorting domain-containing protein [Chitinophagales bacterium]
MRKIYLVLLVILSFQNSNAQWAQWYDSSMIVKLSAGSQSLSYYYFVDEASDGIFVCTSDSDNSWPIPSNIYLTKLNYELQPLWTKVFPNTLAQDTFIIPTHAYSIDSGKVILTGEIEPVSSCTYYSPFFVMIDSNNTVSWAKSFDVACAWNAIYSMGVSSQHNFITNVWQGLPGHIENLLLDVDWNGNLAWSKKIGSDSSGVVYQFASLSSGDFIIASTSGDIFRITPDGTMKWGKHFHTFFSEIQIDSFKQIDLLSGNGIMKLDTNGNVIWFRAPLISSTHNNETIGGFSLTLAPDSGFYLYLVDRYFDDQDEWSNPIYVKLSHDGVIEWVKKGNLSDDHYFVTHSRTQNLMWGWNGPERQGLDITKSCYGLSDIPWGQEDSTLTSADESYFEVYPMALHEINFPSILSTAITLDTTCNEVNFVLTGISDPSTLNQLIRIFPNPSADFIQVQTALPIGSKFEVYISDILGNTLKQESLTAESDGTQISLKELPSGIYFLRVLADGEEETLRICKE